MEAAAMPTAPAKASLREVRGIFIWKLLRIGDDASALSVIVPG